MSPKYDWDDAAVIELMALHQYLIEQRKQKKTRPIKYTGHGPIAPDLDSAEFRLAIFSKFQGIWNKWCNKGTRPVDYIRNGMSCVSVRRLGKERHEKIQARLEELRQSGRETGDGAFLFIEPSSASSPRRVTAGMIQVYQPSHSPTAETTPGDDCKPVGDEPEAEEILSLGTAASKRPAPVSLRCHPGLYQC